MTSPEYIEFVAERLSAFYDVRYKKMFGEYMIYVEDKPVITVCDNTVFVKMYPELSEIMKDAEIGKPYPSAKDCYILDIEDEVLCQKILPILIKKTPIPKKKKA